MDVSSTLDRKSFPTTLSVLSALKYGSGDWAVQQLMLVLVAGMLVGWIISKRVQLLLLQLGAYAAAAALAPTSNDIKQRLLRGPL